MHILRKSLLIFWVKCTYYLGQSYLFNITESGLTLQKNLGGKW